MIYGVTPADRTLRNVNCTPAKSLRHIKVCFCDQSVLMITHVSGSISEQGVAAVSLIAIFAIFSHMSDTSSFLYSQSVNCMCWNGSVKQMHRTGYHSFISIPILKHTNSSETAQDERHVFSTSHFN